jgi:YVTN family beta-propeller protein
VTLDAAGEVVQLTLGDLAEMARLPAGDTPHAVVSVDGRLIVTESRDDRVRQVSPPGASAPAGEMPESLAVVGPYLATADATSGTVSLFDRETLAQVTSIEVGGRPVRVAAFDETTLLVALGGTGELAVIDLERMTVERRIPAGVLADGICVSPSGRYVAVAATGDHTITIVDSERWKAVATIAAPGGPGACLWIGAV